jgi:parallel beta-helix repeat protein
VYANSQTVYGTSQFANPGEQVNIVGDGFSALTQATITYVNADGTDGVTENAPIVATSPNLMQVSVPADFVPGVWHVQVNTAGVPGPGTVWLNRAVPQFADSDQISPGAWFRVYGRNLNPSIVGATGGYIKFVDPTGASITCPATQTDPFDGTKEKFMLAAKIPGSVVPGVPYQVFVSNGAGGTSGEAQLAGTVLGRPANIDPWGFSTPWAQDFTFLNKTYNVVNDGRLAQHAFGDGVHEDLAAIQAAVDYVYKAGGGVVYLPAGTYRCGGTSSSFLRLRSKVLLKGAGSSQTILQVGYQFTSTSAAPPPYPYAIDMTASTLTGLLGVTVQNLNTNSSPNATVIVSSNGGQTSDRVVVKDCVFNLANSLPFCAINATHLYISNINVAVTGKNAAFSLSACNFAELRNSQFSYQLGRPNLTFGSNTIVEDCTVSRDNNFATPGSPESGGLETSYARQLLLRKNTIQGVGPFPTKTGDGELINAQLSNIADMQDLGQVSTADSTTLTNLLANWPTTRSFTAPNYGSFSRSVVTIVSGTGTGQSRFITTNSTNQLTIDKPWDVIPDATSTYAICSWAADQQIIIENNLSNSSMGINLYDGGHECTIDSNTVTNTGGILLRTDDYGKTSGLPITPFSIRRHAVGWGNWISNNVVSDTLGYRPAKISIYATSVDGIEYGNLALNNVIRSNSLKGRNPATTYPSESGSSAGFWNFAILPNVQTVVPQQSVIGTLILSNTYSNITPAFHFLNVWP